MANINFYLKNVATNKKGEKPIIIQITWNYQKFRKQIERVNPKYWNQRKQQVRPPGSGEKDNRYVEINTLIDDQEKKAKEFFNDCLLYNTELNADLIKAFLDGKQLVKKKKLAFFDAFREFLETKKVGHAQRTYTGYKTAMNFLLGFQKEMDYMMNWNNIDFIFFDKLQNYCFQKMEISDNYFSKIIATIKNFMNWASERGYHDSRDYIKFSYSEKQKEVVFLTMEELLLLNNFKFETERLNKARDIFCFGCFTGLRFSDLHQLKREHIIEGYIVKKIQKTQAFSRIPLNKFATGILEKYNDLPVHALPRISNQKINEYIKECCEEAGIKESITYLEYRGGRAIEVIKPKYKLITAHTSRKTFITNSVILDMNIKAIKEITGHKKDSTFDKYLKIADDFKKKEMDKWNNL